MGLKFKLVGHEQDSRKIQCGIHSHVGGTKQQYNILLSTLFKTCRTMVESSHRR